jgi:hypothetical protein
MLLSSTPTELSTTSLRLFAYLLSTRSLDPYSKYLFELSGRKTSEVLLLLKWAAADLRISLMAEYSVSNTHRAHLVDAVSGSCRPLPIWARHSVLRKASTQSCVEFGTTAALLRLAVDRLVNHPRHNSIQIFASQLED